MPKKQVLVVEDEFAHARRVLAALEGHGYEVVLARNTDEAYGRIGARVPDLVVMDIILDDKNAGLRFCEDMHRSSRTRSVPVVFLTVRNSDDAVEWAQRIGVDRRHYFTKPIREVEFLAAVDELLSR